MWREAKGVESLPVSLLLGIVMAACTLGLGLKCIDNAQTFDQRQRAIGSFNSFIERASAVSFGGVGNVQRVELELGGGEIVIDSKLAQLRVGEEVLRSEVLQLPVYAKNARLENGVYEIELKRGTQGYFLEVRKG